jgi:Xaa-Pro aminopeptidase
MFTKDFFSTNRQNFWRRIGSQVDLVVISANAKVQSIGDEAAVFKQDRDFWYLTGLDDPMAILVMTPSETYLIMPDKSIYQKIFEGDYSRESISVRSGIGDIYDSANGWQKLSLAIKRSQKMALNVGSAGLEADLGMFASPIYESIRQKITSLHQNIEIIDAKKILAEMRMVKQPIEIVAIRKAIEITGLALRDALRPETLASYSHEYQIESAITHGMRSRGALGNAYPPIVASGKNATVLHYCDNSAIVNSNDTILLDVGAEYDHYSADISRTIHLGDPSQQQLAVFDAVRAVQAYAIKQLRPKVKLATYEQKVRKYMGKKLLELGLVDSNTPEQVNRFYLHSTSHFLGLNTHDVGDYDMPLRSGMVLTVEPGIYIAHEGIGVRIEDDILITPTGAEVLSRDIPSNLIQC